jgi:lipoate-protein ligase A
MERDRWRLITTWGAAPGFNMGLDEALLESAESPPTLRFYTWHPAALSLGYFQRFDDVPAAAQTKAVVRRITGGGAIHHANELTFSITAPLDHPVYAGPTAASYARVHAAIARSLRELGAPAAPRGDAPVVSDRPETGMCFHESTPLDLVWSARKGVGSAQRRKNGRVLHHGSIMLGPSPLEGDIATLAEFAKVTPEEYAPVLRRALAEELDLRFDAGVPDADERERTKELAPRYLDPAFVRRR